ncbi:MAG: hypothetical protein JNG86_12005 [Verrucomicrobiaceae bacterium]|nr:hypothetical protein [Verrucomicrobiaceae bacterium]
MNNASKDPRHHLAALLERLQHPTDYEKALHYFLEEFAGDMPFIASGEAVSAPVLGAVVRHVIKSAAGTAQPFQPAKVFRVAEHGFHHGSGAAGARAVIFFHFESVNKGLVAIIPGFNGPVDVARFSLPATLPVDTSKN